MIKFIIASIHLYWLKRKADISKSLTKRPQYVIKWEGKLKVVSSKNIRDMRKKRMLAKSLNWLKLQDLAIYKTN
jgi:hypothetical protein